MLRRRPPLRQKQSGEKEAVVWQFNDPDIALSADTGDGQYTSFQVFTKCRIEAVVAKILGHNVRYLANLMHAAAGCQMNGLSLSHQRAGELANEKARCGRRILLMIGIG